MHVGLLLGFAEAVLALDLDVVEAVFEREPHDLGALRLGRAVGDQRQLDPELLQPVERLVRAGKHAQFGLVDLLEPVGDRVAQLGRRRRQRRPAASSHSAFVDDVAARVADAVAPMLVARLIGPEIARIVLDRAR